MSGLELFWIGLVDALSPFNFAMMLTGLTIGVLAGALPGITMLNAIVLVLPFTYSMDIVPSLLLMTCGLRRRHLRRLHHRDPLQHPGRPHERAGHLGGLRPQQEGPRGPGAGGGHHGLGARRVSELPRDDPGLAAVRQGGAVLLLGRVLRGRLPGAGERRGDQHQVHRLLADRALPRHAARHDRHRRHVRGGPVHVRLAPAGDRDQLHHRPDRALRDRRGVRAALRAQQGAGRGHEGAAQGAPAAAARDPGSSRGRCCGASGSARSSAPSRAPGPPWPRS